MSARALMFDILLEYSLWQDLSMNTNVFDSVNLTLAVDQFFENFNLTTNFWAVSARALMHVFHMCILCDNIFPLVPNIFYPVTLTFEIGLLFENFNLATNYKQWVQEFHLNNPCNHIFLLNFTFDLFFKKWHLS